LHEQREWLRVALASIGDAVITTDTHHCVTFLNPAAQTLTGWTQEEAADVPLDSVFRIINEESRQPVESPSVRALREGVLVGLANHSLLLTKDGTERPIDHSAAPIRNDQGEVVGVVLVFRDASERRRQAKQVAESLAYADNIIATLREPFVVLDQSLCVQTANSAFYRTFNVAKGETEGRFVYDLGNRQWDIPRLRELLEELLPQNHSFENFEVEYDFPTIGTKVMLLNAHRFESVVGHPNLLLLAFEDITERRRAEAAVKDSELRYRQLFQTAKDGILIVDADTGEIIDANPFMHELLGYAPGAFLGKELWEIGLFGDREASRTAYRELQEKGYIRYDHLPLQTTSGRQVEVEFVCNVYSVDYRRVAQCNVRDISDRSRLERQTREQAAALADLDRRKDEFLAMLSHELRNPLAPILNAVHLLRSQGNESRVHQQARTIIERQVEQLVRLVDDLLEVSRITTGRVRLQQERLDVRGVVAQAVEGVRPLIDRRQQELTVALPPEPVWLHADPTRLEQVLVNLLTNAAKYSDEGSRIGLTVQPEGEEVVVRVRDTGIGIAPELLPHIFDLFTQAERSLDRSQGGLGIGLCLVQRLVEMHGGTVEASSAGLGQGSAFTVRLPVRLPTATPPPASHVEPVEQPTPTRRVLVVDDSEDTAESMAMLLSMSGYDVRMAHTGPTALEAAVTYQPHVVLLDIGLPGMDGYEVARRLRQHPHLQGVRLVAVTGYGLASELQRSHEAGFDAHLVKPVDPQKVRALVTTLLGQH
jgi:PAS domain S-box-containing protein